ncbi:hypothetical protein [Bacillus piscicola]|uniref:hypothetical protein n=1 Tax=Bacillus piscicola TaxID=1632684 RepID=UPI001F08A353|nr:hypothetical protein [Bacillus piscicola]
MNKLLTGLAVWTIFLFVMGIFFPIPTTSAATSVEKVMQSYTIYGFYSLTPIVFYGSGISLVADWLAHRFKRFVQPLSFLFHVVGGITCYLVTQNIDITILAVMAAIIFFLADRFFNLFDQAPAKIYSLQNLPIVLGIIGITAMVIGSAIG